MEKCNQVTPLPFKGLNTLRAKRTTKNSEFH